MSAWLRLAALRRVRLLWQSEATPRTANEAIFLPLSFDVQVIPVPSQRERTVGQLQRVTLGRVGTANAHFQYHLSGVMRVRMDDGQVFDCKAGDVSLLPSGHDAWVVGDEPVVVIDFQGMIDYAKTVLY